ARDYDPATGKWTGRDPIAFRGGTANLLEYMGNCPTDGADPSGLSPTAQLCSRPLHSGWLTRLAMHVSSFVYYGGNAGTHRQFLFSDGRNAGVLEPYPGHKRLGPGRSPLWNTEDPKYYSEYTCDATDYDADKLADAIDKTPWSPTLPD